MPPMKIIPLRNFKTLNIQNINRLDNGMYGMLIMKVLIKITIPALIIIRTHSKPDTPLHVVQAGPLTQRQFSHLFFPKKYFTPFTLRDLAFFPEPAILLRNPHHGFIETAGFTVKIMVTVFLVNYSGMHPYTFHRLIVLPNL
jgi:hypothetical protein